MGSGDRFYCGMWTPRKKLASLPGWHPAAQCGRPRRGLRTRPARPAHRCGAGHIDKERVRGTVGDVVYCRHGRLGICLLDPYVRIPHQMGQPGRLEPHRTFAAMNLERFHHLPPVNQPSGPSSQSSTLQPASYHFEVPDRTPRSRTCIQHQRQRPATNHI